MMQVPLSSYPHFSQFLQLQHLHQQRFSRAYGTHGPDLGMLSASGRTSGGGTSCSEASTETPSSSPSPPLSITENANVPSGPTPHPAKSSVKSFTIDAILGLRDRDIEKIEGDHLSAVPNNFRSRLGLGLAGSHLESYANSLDLSNTSLEIGIRSEVASRYSVASRDLLPFQLPTDLTTSPDVPGTEINCRNIQNQMSTFQNSGSCSGSTEKSPGEIGKKCGGKSKRVRTIFTPEQLERLEAEFERQQYMVGPERLYLAHTLQLTEAQVKVWFQNRRIKWRKQHLEIQQQRLAAIKQQNQRGDVEESDGEESGDSNNFTYSGDSVPGETAPTSSTFFKTPETDSDVNLTSFRGAKVSSPSSLCAGENPNDNESSGENI